MKAKGNMQRLYCVWFHNEYCTYHDFLGGVYSDFKYLDVYTKYISTSKSITCIIW